jgi:small-conductance mechanosensitive channel
MRLHTLLRGLIVAISFTGPLVAEAGQAAQPVSGAPSQASPAAPASGLDPIAVRSLTEAGPPEEAFTLKYGNRPIVEFRARLVGRTPQERAEGTVRRLDELAALGLYAPVESAVVGGVAVVTVAGRDAVMVLPADIDASAGETLETAGRAAAANLSKAMAEVREAHSPKLLLFDALRAIAGTLVALLLGSVLWWMRGPLASRLAAWADARLVSSLARRAPGDFRRTVEAGLVAALRSLSRLILLGLSAALVYAWLTFTLRQFPYTRPWGEALSGFVVASVADLGQGMLYAIPGLFSVALIVVITRVAVRLANTVFRAAEQGRLALPGVFAETAQPTRRLMVALLWILAVVFAYPHLPGSGSEAFTGMSVLLGLMLSLGSSGLVNQVMSSFMITYSRAVRVGEFVRIGEVEGSVVHTGVLATKLMTPLREEVTLPNAVVASSTITNYSRRLEEGVFAGTSVTIGYDTPWRQVEALLLQAAARTAGLRPAPAPFVLQSGLKDFYVEYRLMVALERPADRPVVLSQLHGHVQDAFNEHGLQIMSPNYEADPATPKIVPRDQWFAPPARPGVPTMEPPA